MDALGPAPWRIVYVLAPDYRLLKHSLLTYGWVAPVVAQKDTGLVIDGWHRLRLHQSTPDIRKKWGTKVPVLWMDVDDVDARICHVHLNRARGKPIAKALSNLVRDVLASKKYDTDQLRSILGMTFDEMELLADGGDLLKVRKVREHGYSPAWVPVEAAPGTVIAPEIQIERPPTKDR